MNISSEQIIAILSEYNPWWRGERFPDLPQWKRAAFHDLYSWATSPPAPRAVFLSGARQIGKTTLLLQSIEKLLEAGVHPSNILYATFDHPILKLVGIDATLSAWRSREPMQEGYEFLFLDEAQFIKDWGTWIKHQVDFNKKQRIIFTGSTMPLHDAGQESGVGRWYTIKLTTLSFYEYLQIKKVDLPELPNIQSLTQIFSFSPQDTDRCKHNGAKYTAHFHEYLLRGGFPQTAQIENISSAQKLMREDIVDKVLKRDMTATYNLRNVIDLEHLFLYLCMHDGGLLDLSGLCKNLEVKKPTILRYISFLENSHLVYKLSPYGYGKDVLRAKYKLYLADAAIASAVLLKTKETLLENPIDLGIATETAVFKHLFARYYHQDIRFSYWRGKKNHEIDLIGSLGLLNIPFEVKYRNEPSLKEVPGMLEFMADKNIPRGYVITKLPDDFGPLHKEHAIGKKILKIPAPLLCYWMGKNELEDFKIN